MDEDKRSLRLGSCNRNADRLVRDLATFDGHIPRFRASAPRFARWKVEKVAIAPTLGAEHRRHAAAAGYLPQDLNDLTRELRGD